MNSVNISSQPSAKELEPNSQKQTEVPQKNKEDKSRLSKWLLAILFLGGAGFTSWQILVPDSAPTAQTVTQAPPPKAVETTVLTPGAGNRQVRLLGQVEAGEKATLSPQIDGTLNRILVREGDRVSQGMVVAVLDDADAQLALAEARARLAQAQNNLERLQVGTRPEVIAQRQAELQSAQAREAEAQTNLNSLIALQPDLVAQRQAELQSAQAREKEAQDNLARVQTLSEEGAISERALVEAQSRLDTAKSDRFRAESALQAQQTQTNQDIAEARTRLDNIRNEKLRIQASLAEAQAGFTSEEIAAQKSLVQVAQANVEQAQLALQRTEIKAPFSGIIQARNVDMGDYVEINDSLVTLVSDRSLDIFLEIPESLSGQVVQGMRVSLNARALSDWQKETTITAVVPSADRNSRRQLVRVSLDNPPQGLLPGMAIQANLDVPVENADAFIVPRDALTRRGNEWLLFKVNNNQAQQIAVEMLADLGTDVVIANPELKEGETIVVTGGDGLTDNATVQVVGQDG